MSSVDSTLDLIKSIITNPDFDSQDSLIKQHFDFLATYPLKALYSLPRTPFVLALIFTNLCEQKEYTAIPDFTTNELITQLMGCEKKNDFVNSKILIAFYAAIKKTNGFDELFFIFLQSNEEMDNKECISVLTNIVIDITIKTNFILANKYFKKEMSNLEQQAIHCYYKGWYYLVAGEYKEAHHNLQSGMIMSNNKAFVKRVEKLFITNMLLRSDLLFLKGYNWRVGLSHYFELYEAVKGGNIHLFNELMEINKELYKKDKTYNIVMRLYKNVVEEGLRRIGICYSRIHIGDIAKMISIDAEDTRVLLEKRTNEGLLSGKISGDVFTNEERGVKRVSFTENIKDCIDTYTSIKKMMKYPKSKPLSIENIDKNSIAYDLHVL